MALATIIRSPNIWVTSLMYGVSPQPAQAPENSNSGRFSWLPLTVAGSMSAFGHFRQVQEVLDVGLLLIPQCLGIGDHLQGLGLGRAGVDAEGAAAAVLGEDLDRGLAALELLAHGVDGLEALGRLLQIRRFDDLHADGGMRADQGTAAALDAVFRQPFGHVHGDVAFLVLGGAGGPGAVIRHLGDLDLVALALDHLGGDLLDEVGGVGRHDRRHLAWPPAALVEIFTSTMLLTAASTAS